MKNIKLFNRIKEIIMMLLLCVMAVYAHAQISNQMIDLSEDNGSEQLTLAVHYYYKNPNPKDALHLSLELMKQPVFESKSNFRLNTWLWGAQVLQQQSSSQTRKWCKTLKENQPVMNIAPIFQLTNTPAAKRCLKSLALNEEEQYQLSQLPDLSQPLGIHLQQPADLDVLWTTFFATGNPKAIHKLVDFVTFIPENPAYFQEGMYATALWSLQSNIKQDVIIKQIVEEYVAQFNPIQQASLKSRLQI